MSIAKLQAMTETLRKMEEMQKEVNEDVNKDINKKRKEALKKIREYLNEVADSLDGLKITVDFPKGTIFDGYENGEQITFNSTYPTHYSSNCGYKWSDEPIKWYIDRYCSHKSSNSDYWYYIDAENDIEIVSEPGKWSYGFIRLIENWSDIKPLIEKGVEEQLAKRMQTIREETTKRVTSYKKVDEFEV